MPRPSGLTIVHEFTLHEIPLFFDTVLDPDPDLMHLPAASGLSPIGASVGACIHRQTDEGGKVMRAIGICLQHRTCQALVRGYGCSR